MIGKQFEQLPPSSLLRPEPSVALTGGRGDGGAGEAKACFVWWAPEPSLNRAKDRHPHGPRPAFLIIQGT